MAQLEDVIIAFMGLTGTGKSSLIKLATGNSAVHVQDDLHSGTQEIEAYRFNHAGKSYVLVDTPGFDDSSKSDAVVVEELLQWLETSFRQGKQLNGIIYVHSILEPRMKGSALRNMSMFRKLCGPDCYQNVVLGTTFWDQLESKGMGEEREKELKQNPKFWGSMVQKKSKVVRLAQDKKSILDIIKLIGSKDKMILQAQTELVVERKSRAQTAAARLVNEQATQLEEERKRIIHQERVAAEKRFAEQEAETERKAKAQRDALAAELSEQRRKNRERQENQEWEARELKESRQKAKELAAREERDRVVREAERIERENAARLERQRESERRAAQIRANYYRSFRCANTTPRGNCDKCGSRLSSWKYYFHCCHCFTADNYWHCGPCGPVCGKTEHPLMRKGLTDDCVIM